MKKFFMISMAMLLCLMLAVPVFAAEMETTPASEDVSWDSADSVIALDPDTVISSDSLLTEWLESGNIVQWDPEAGKFVTPDGEEISVGVLEGIMDGETSTVITDEILAEIENYDLDTIITYGEEGAQTTGAEKEKVSFDFMQWLLDIWQAILDFLGF